MPATNVTSQWEGGDLVFRTAAGAEILRLGGTTGHVSMQGVSLAAIPTEDPGDGVTIWSDDGVLKVSVDAG